MPYIQPISASNGYRYSYEGGAGEIYLYSVDNSVRIYEIAVEDYNEDDWCPIDSYENTVWDFEDLVEQGTITSHITYTENYNTMDVYASSEKPVRVIKNTSTTKDGYRYFQVLNLDGTGSDTYRTLAFNVHMESTIYITAKAESGTELYITNKYACPLDTDLGGDILNLTSEYVTYKINYNGYGEKVYIRSKDNNIRIAQIAVTAHDLYGADEHDFNPSNEEQLTIGEVITDKSVNGYHILSVESRPATVVATTEAGYTKALELTSGEHMKNMARISFEIGDSRGTSNTNPKRAIRIKAKANTTGLNLVLGNEYGYIIDIKPMSTTLDEYIFDYSDYKDKLYLFAFGSTVQWSCIASQKQIQIITLRLHLSF